MSRDKRGQRRDFEGGFSGSHREEKPETSEEMEDRKEHTNRTRAKGGKEKIGVRR